MSKRTGLLLFFALAAVFLAANRSAYRGYFQDDEFDTLSWARYGSALDYLKGAASPLFQDNNFRPAGHFYFHAAANAFGLDFPKYIAVIHAIHLFNAWLVWLLARSLRAPPAAAAAGTVFFALHMALFDDFWKPMYVFDVLCATFCLFSLLLYARGRWVWSFVSFWLAYKAKELAVMLPLVLAAYELWFGERRWKRLIPFFAVSLSFGLQALIRNPNQDNEYTFRFTAAALAKTSRFYADRIFLTPYLGFALPLAFLRRSRPIWFGLAITAVFFLPLLFLPGRLFAAYCYLPFTGLAIALTGLVEGLSWPWLALLLVAWAPLDVHAFRVQSRLTLARDNEIRAWVESVDAFAKSNPQVSSFVVDGAPEGFARWGVEGALKYIFQRFDLKVTYSGEPTASENPALLRWDRSRHRLEITPRR